MPVPHVLLLLCCLPYLVSCLLLLLLWGGRRLAVGQAFWLLLSPQITIKISWHCPGSLNVISGRRISVAVGLEIAVAVAVAVAEFCRNYRYLMQICVAYFVVGFFFPTKFKYKNNSKCFFCLPAICVLCLRLQKSIFCPVLSTAPSDADSI